MTQQWTLAAVISVISVVSVISVLGPRIAYIHTVNV